MRRSSVCMSSLQADRQFALCRLAFDRSVLSRVHQSKNLPRRFDVPNGPHGNGPRIIMLYALLNRNASLNPVANVYSGVPHNLINRPICVKRLPRDKTFAATYADPNSAIFRKNHRTPFATDQSVLPHLKIEQYLFTI